MDYFEWSTSQPLCLPLCLKFPQLICVERDQTYQQCQPLVWDSHSSNLGVSEELNMVEDVKGDERKVDRAWLSGPFQSQVLGCAGGCPITSWVASQAPKSCSVPAADTWVDRPSAKGFQKHLSLGHLKCSVRPATCSPFICIPRSSRRAASSVWLRSSLFSITGLRGGSDESGTHCFHTRWAGF